MRVIGQTIIRWLRQAIDAFLVVTFTAMFGSVLLQVAVRAFTSFSIVGTEEIANYSQLWLVMIGAGVALRFGRHVAVDVLVTLLPEKLRFQIRIVNTIVILWLLAMIFIGALPLLDMGMFQTSPALGLPMWLAYACLPTGAVYMALELVLTLFPPADAATPGDDAQVEQL